MKKRIITVLLALVLISGFAPNIMATNSTIAVMPFEIGGTLDNWWWWGTDEMLDGIAQRITDKLANEPDLTIVDRTRIQDILAEQELQQSGAVDLSTAVEIGRLLGADLLLVGTLNEFGFKNEGGVSVSFISVKRSNANVKLSARLISVQTGQVLASFEGVGKDSGTSLSVDYFKGISFNSSEFENSVLGKALGKSIDDLMTKFRPALKNAQSRSSGPATTATTTATGKIAAVTGNYIILDVGSVDGVTDKTKFDVYHLQIIEGLPNPVRIPLGTLRVMSVDLNATVTSIEKMADGAPPIAAGDIVEYSKAK